METMCGKRKSHRLVATLPVVFVESPSEAGNLTVRGTAICVYHETRRPEMEAKTIVQAVGRISHGIFIAITRNGGVVVDLRQG